MSAEPKNDVSETSKPEEKSETEENKTNDHPVFTAIKECGDDIEKIRNFFEVDGVSVEIEDSIGMTPLMHACWKGHINVAKFLIKQVRIDSCSLPYQ
jgi:hypothetical protein